MAERDKIKWNKVGKFVIFKGKKFYYPYQCLCCGKIVSERQFCFGRLCAYCDVGRCGGHEEGHGRKDIFENAEDLEDDFTETIKEKLKEIKMNKEDKINAEILNSNCSEVIWKLEVPQEIKKGILISLGVDILEFKEEEFCAYNNYPNDCLSDMMKRLGEIIKINETNLVIVENNTFEYVSEYVEECFKIAKRFKYGQITMLEAKILDKEVWDKIVKREEEY